MHLARFSEHCNIFKAGSWLLCKNVVQILADTCDLLNWSCFSWNNSFSGVCQKCRWSQEPVMNFQCFLYMNMSHNENQFGTDLNFVREMECSHAVCNDMNALAVLIYDGLLRSKKKHSKIYNLRKTINYPMLEIGLESRTIDKSKTSAIFMLGMCWISASSSRLGGP